MRTRSERSSFESFRTSFKTPSAHGSLDHFLPSPVGVKCRGEARGGPDVFLVFLFAAGALSMRGAGCIYNDIVDRDLDSLMVRTQS